MEAIAAVSCPEKKLVRMPQAISLDVLYRDIPDHFMGVFYLLNFSQEGVRTFDHEAVGGNHVLSSGVDLRAGFSA